MVTTDFLHLEPFAGVEFKMSQPSGKPIYIPPFAGVRLVEYRDCLQLVPVPDVRVVYGYGKIKASEATINPDNPKSEPVWDDLGADAEVWAVVQWYIYADGHQEPGNMCFVRPECSEDEVKERMDRMERMSSHTRDELLKMTQCFEATADDFEFIEDNYPNYQSEPDPKKIDEHDVYHARLKVMGELQPKTVELIKIANATKDPAKRKFVEQEMVQSYFAELAGYVSVQGCVCHRAAVDGQLFLSQFDHIARQTNHAFNQPRPIFGRVKHHNVTALGVRPRGQMPGGERNLQVIRQFVDEDPIPFKNRWLHGTRRHVIPVGKRGADGTQHQPQNQ